MTKTPFFISIEKFVEVKGVIVVFSVNLCPLIDFVSEHWTDLIGKQVEAG